MRSVLAYAPRPGPLGRARPWIAAAYLAPLAIIAFAFANPLVLVAAGATAAAAGIASGAGRSIAQPLRWSLGLAVMVVVVNAIASQRGDTVLIRGFDFPVLGQIDVTLEALAEGAVLALRIVVALLVFAVWSACVDPDRVLRAIRSSHPYEEPAIDVIPLRGGALGGGIGAVGELAAAAPRPDAGREAVGRAVGKPDRVRLVLEAHRHQHRPEHLLLEIARPVEGDNGGWHVQPLLRQRGIAIPAETKPSLRFHGCDPAEQTGMGIFVDHRPHMGCRIARITELQGLRRTGDHVEHVVGNVLLQA